MALWILSVPTQGREVIQLAWQATRQRDRGGCESRRGRYMSSAVHSRCKVKRLEHFSHAGTLGVSERMQGGGLPRKACWDPGGAQREQRRNLPSWRKAQRHLWPNLTTKKILSLGEREEMRRWCFSKQSGIWPGIGVLRSLQGGIGTLGYWRGTFIVVKRGKNKSETSKV